MNDYADWSEKFVSVTSLHLDYKNPRIPDIGHEPTQREIVAELLQNENVYELARDIAAQGFFPTEVLIAVDEDSKSIVVEGNRRLAAVKLLLSPELAPDSEIKKFRMLQSRISADAIRKLPVVFAPSRELAAPMIIARHTRQGIHRWKPAQQAKYLRSLITPGVPIDDLAEQFGVARSELLDAVKQDTMLRIAGSLELPEDVSQVVRDPKKFPASVLERLLDNPTTLEFLGLQFDDDAHMRGKISTDEFKKGYKRIVTDIARGNIDTRLLNSAEEIQAYLSSLGADTPDRRKKGSFNASAILDGHVETPSTSASTSTKKSRQNNSISKSIIPKGTKCQLSNPRINDIFKELRSLKVAEHPNATAVLLRIFLEMIVGHYLNKANKMQPILDRAKKNNKPADWAPTLRQMLREILDDKEIRLAPLVRKGLNKMVADDDHPLSLDHMDAFVHNPYIAPTEKELRKLWTLLEDLIKQLLVEPAVSATPKLNASPVAVPS